MSKYPGDQSELFIWHLGGLFLESFEKWMESVETAGFFKVPKEAKERKKLLSKYKELFKSPAYEFSGN